MRQDIVDKIASGVFKITTKKKVRSKIWNIFAEVQNQDGEILDNVVYCRSCNHVFKYNGKQTSNLVRHKCYISEKYDIPLKRLQQEETEDSHSSLIICKEETLQEDDVEQSPAIRASTSSCSSILPQPSPRKRGLPGATAKQTEKACFYLEQSNEPQEKFPTIAKAWGEKLLTLESQQRIFAEKAINDVLFEACQGNLHRHSIKINEDFT